MIAQTRRRVQQPRSVLLDAEKLFKLDLINRQKDDCCGAYAAAGVNVNRTMRIAIVDVAFGREACLHGLNRNVAGWRRSCHSVASTGSAFTARSGSFRTIR